MARSGVEEFVFIGRLRPSLGGTWLIRICPRTEKQRIKKEKTSAERGSGGGR